MNTYFYIYIVGTVITTMAFVEEADAKDIFSSLFLGLLWPIVLPALLVRKYIDICRSKSMK